ncbi:MAG: lipopolysaccharide transport periplasmic protein LptA [Zhongshania sp.]|uniref:lipopolysaccharide transport periplasmic protein LptA n=1 Tax=Zhongshania sp. TaxID=1971902 RepID=UPI0026303671|nr:lipopolysaccharide transport periplasmic protein LptA [Zhongshania sp.]MDF1693027.1 lipopolysaccharide transport periplasmic protein LptA [Zhongshania sp.]
MTPSKAALATTLLLSVSCIALSLPEDRKQAINLSSDRAIYENNQGVYIGNVSMSQGSLKISADKLTIIEANRKVEKVIAEGSPAYFEQQPRADEGVVVASAQRIEYSLQQEEILLQRNASITHRGSKISGDRVVYNGRKQMVVADGGTAEKEHRVKMTLQPQAIPDSEAPADDKPATSPTVESTNSEESP